MQIVNKIYVISETHGLAPMNKCSTHLDQGKDINMSAEIICVFSYQGGKSLKDFEDTEVPRLKFCSTCKKHVEIIHEESELLDASKNERCVVIVDNRIAKIIKKSYSCIGKQLVGSVRLPS